MFQRVVKTRVIWNRAEEAKLRQTQILTTGTEVPLGCCLDAIISIGKINAVQIKFQNLVFRIFFFQFKSHKNLSNLTVVGLFLVQKDTAGKLLRDRTCSLRNLTIVLNQC